MKKVLIITTASGEGHNSVAKSVKIKLEEIGNIEVKIVDLFNEYGTKFKKYVMYDFYKHVCKYPLLGVYNVMYKIFGTLAPESREISPAQSTVKEEMTFLLKEILTYKPDSIITTNIYPAIAVSDLKRFCGLKTLSCFVNTDYGVPPFSESTIGVDYIFSSCEDCIESFKEKGFKDSQIVTTGIPIREVFYKEISKEETREKLGLNKDMFTVMLMMGGGGSMGGMLSMFLTLLKVKKPIQIVAVNGKDKETKQDIEDLSKWKNTKHKIVNLGFINNVDEYMTASDCMVGKCGGLSVTECLNKSLPFLTKKNLAEQEMDNLKYFSKHECCFVIDSKNKLNKIIDELQENPSILEKARTNMKSLQMKYSVNKICELMLAGDKPDYKVLCEKYNINDEKIKKNIKKSKKKYIEKTKEIEKIGEIRQFAVEKKEKKKEKDIKTISTARKKVTKMKEKEKEEKIKKLSSARKKVKKYYDKIEKDL